MNAISNKLDTELIADLTAIRSAVGKLPDARLPWNARDPVDLIDQGNRMIDCFENWLLDDEQTQILGMQPRQLFILYASAYLGDIGLTDGAGLAKASLSESLYTRSGELIRTNWQALGIADATLADIITRVCLQAGNHDGADPSAAESKAAVIDGAAVNVPLLAACLRLGRALNPNSATTLSQIYDHLPTKDRFAEDRLEDYFSVYDIGPHPYLNGTIRLRIQCTDPEIHRALKHHERSVQHLLETINQQVRPRFLYSEVIYEIEPQGYTPIDLKFTVDSSAGLQLFMGNRLYSDRRAWMPATTASCSINTIRQPFRLNSATTSVSSRCATTVSE